MALAKKRIALFVDNLYQELEVWYPLLRMKEAGVDSGHGRSRGGQDYTSKLGYPVKADKSYDQVSAAEFDGVIVPGGYAPDHIRRHPRAIELVKETTYQRQAGGGYLPRALGTLLNGHAQGEASHGLLLHQRRPGKRRGFVRRRRGRRGRLARDLAQA